MDLRFCSRADGPAVLPYLGIAFAMAARRCLTIAFAITLVTVRGVAPEPDVRRDAVVEAVQKVMPAVVNVATETLVEVRDPIEQMFRDFFDPYYRRRPPNTQRSLGSGVIIDEEGYVLTNFHVVNRASRVARGMGRRTARRIQPRLA